jgi:hypothetical protein
MTQGGVCGGKRHKKWIATFASSLAMTGVGVILRQQNTANLFAVSFPVVTAKH